MSAPWKKLVCFRATFSDTPPTSTPRVSRFVVFLAALAAACSSTASHTSGGATDGGAGSGATGASGGAAGTGAGATAGFDGSAGTAGASGDAGACDPAEQPGTGIFVSVSSGDDAAGDGSAALPVKSIRQGLAVAAASGASVVYLDQGTYPESVTIDASNSGVTLRGGFKAVGAAWTRDCSATSRSKTVIASPSNVGVRIENVDRKTTLETVTILTRAVGTSANDQPGESCYGVVVTGDGAPVAIVDAQITAGSGGDGGAVMATGPGVGASCDGLSDCADGSNGTAGNDGTPASAGSFASSLYVAGDGQDAESGSPGRHGTQGGAATSATCYYSGCAGGGGNCSGLQCFDFGMQSVSSSPGKCGCGGASGGGGKGGKGGGASIALLVEGQGAVVNVASSALTAKDGGDGSAGAAGQQGITGSPGTLGASASCPGPCQSVDKGGGQCNCEQPGTTTLPGGTAGGTGGTGGPGGQGGGGAGGPSIGVVRMTGALVVIDGVSLVSFGVGGKGASGAPDGGAQSSLVVP